MLMTIGLVAYCLVGTVAMALILRASTLCETQPEPDSQLPTQPLIMPPQQHLSPFAHLLGKTVEAKVYEASEWERMVVVAVSWQGAVCVRPEGDMRTKGRWIRKEVVPSRVREIC